MNLADVAHGRTLGGCPRTGAPAHPSARTDQYKMTIDSLTRHPLGLYGIENDPDEPRNLVDEPRLSEVRDRFLEEYFSLFLTNLNEPPLRVYQDGGIPTKLHQEYPEY